jgi:ADP-ribosylglycohydrolase
MPELDLHGERFKDKVLGCWLGKNCGGTLGTPVEEAWGRPEPFDIWWYPELRSGGLPNDDLEMQLVWLTALEQVGPELTAADLARYWLDHIGYNFDEYGLSKTNLRLGLQPPVSGAYNNWFTDCMGCPIRSEVWACVAPGHPRIAARYAYQDAICDHAGGESVYGELFNVAIQSSAFVIDDPQRLLDIGISYVPESSATYRAIRAARDAHAEGLDWQQARERVLAATPSPVAQYSPINLGFQVIGWLYGTDFGDALCKTVNCGYDTDSSGGSIGSWLGIRAGMAGLPPKWTEPFGLGLSTNESWGGVRHLTDGSTPIPTDIVALTDKIILQAERVLSHHRIRIDQGRIAVDEAELFADETITALWNASPWTISRHDPQLDIAVDYRGSAAIEAGRPRRLSIMVSNPHPDPVTVDLDVQVPGGWRADHPGVIELLPAGQQTVEIEVAAPDRSSLRQRNPVMITAQPRRYPQTAPMPVALVGASAWRLLLDPVPADPSALPDRDRSSDSWREFAVWSNAVPVAGLLDGRDVIVLQTFIEAAEGQEIRLAADSSVPATMWVNGRPLVEVTSPRLIRPSYGAAEEVNKIVKLEAGFNEVLLQVRPADDGTRPELHVYCSEPDRLRNGIVHLGRTRFPWD